MLKELAWSKNKYIEIWLSMQNAIFKTVSIRPGLLRADSKTIESILRRGEKAESYISHSDIDVFNDSMDYWLAYKLSSKENLIFICFDML